MGYLLTCSAVAATILITGCQQPTATPLSANELEAVKGVGRAYQDAINAEDVDGIVAVFAPDGISLPPGWAPLQGSEAIRRFWEGQVTGVSGGGSYKTIVTYGENDLAFDAGTYTYTFTDAAGIRQTRHGKFLGVYRRRADGTWKLAADMWNLTPAAKAPGAHE